MSTFGLIGLVVALMAAAISIICLIAGRVLEVRGKAEAAETVSWAGCVAVVLTAIALTVCCGILVFCFLTGDYSIKYVLLERSKASGSMRLLYDISGLWAGREGSLLFWTWLISLYNVTIAARALRHPDSMDHMALMTSQVVLLAFVSLSLFSESNMPFTVTAAPYVDEAGNLTSAANAAGMSPLLEHWAQAIHPPTLFVGYAGLTIPFAYAIAALILGDSGKKWVVRSNGYAVFSWLFLGIGIGLGAIWAYVVLGWGGYWAWDPVENASLLSWMVALALVHCFTVYRRRGGFKRWSVMCATLAFSFVVVGTFITRSGVVQSVHSFAQDPVSLVIFGLIIAVSVAVSLAGVGLRWKRFESDDDIQSMMSKNAAYYFNNVIMIVFTLMLTYMTVSSALPSWLPFGGQSLAAQTYNAVARPVGIFYCLIIAVCPLLAWGITDRARFASQIKVPAIAATAIFVALLAYFVARLHPAYVATVAGGGSIGNKLAQEGPAWYYNGLAVVGFAVAALLFCTTLMMIVRSASGRAKATGAHPIAAFFGLFRTNPSKYGGFLSHFAMALILVGLVGSNMFVTETSQYLAFDQDADTAEDVTVSNYGLHYVTSSVEQNEAGDTATYTVVFDVTDEKTGKDLGEVSPSIDMNLATMETKLNASIIHMPTEDLFVVYRGVSNSGELAIDVKINPLIGFVWVGFFLLMLGTAIALFGHRRRGRNDGSSTDVDEDTLVQVVGAPAKAPVAKEDGAVAAKDSTVKGRDAGAKGPDAKGPSVG